MTPGTGVGGLGVERGLEATLDQPDMPEREGISRSGDLKEVGVRLSGEGAADLWPLPFLSPVRGVFHAMDAKEASLLLMGMLMGVTILPGGVWGEEAL